MSPLIQFKENASMFLCFDFKKRHIFAVAICRSPWGGVVENRVAEVLGLAQM